MSMRGYPLYTFKMILLGESGSGKTCLFHRIIYNQYRDGRGTYENKTFAITLQYENHTKQVELSENIRVNVCTPHTQQFLHVMNLFVAQVKVFDTGGGERANSVTQKYYKNAHMVCLVYAMDSDLSFSALGKWIEDARRLYLEESQRQPKMVFAMVGIKSDLPQCEREVKTEDVKRAAQHFNIPSDCCFEVSNISGDGILHMMKHLAQKVFDLHTRQNSQSTTELHSYSSEHSELFDNSDIAQPMTFTQWLCHWCCCCCCSRHYGYQSISN